MQGLHAQGAKLKAWSVGEIELVSGPTVSASYLKDARDAIANAHGQFTEVTIVLPRKSAVSGTDRGET
jgi:hypothetical protein